MKTINFDPAIPPQTAMQRQAANADEDFRKRFEYEKAHGLWKSKPIPEKIMEWALRRIQKG